MCCKHLSFHAKFTLSYVEQRFTIMSAIKTTRDDISVQNIILKNKQSSAVNAPQKTSAYPAIDQSVSTAPPVHFKRKFYQQRKGDRRKNERRLQHQNVFLDTRSHHDRRKNDRLVSLLGIK